MRPFLLFPLIFCVLGVTACSHEAENTGMRNSSSVITLPGTFAMEINAAPVQTAEAAPASAYTDVSPVSEGKVSRYERQMIVTKHSGEPMSPCAKNFDEVMNYLEMLMADKIKENNEEAAANAAAYKS